MTLLDIINYVKVGVENAVLSLWLSMKLYLRVYREPVRHFKLATFLVKSVYYITDDLCTTSRMICVLHHG